MQLSCFIYQYGCDRHLIRGVAYGLRCFNPMHRCDTDENEVPGGRKWLIWDDRTPETRRDAEKRLNLSP